MSDMMTCMPFGQLMDWVLQEKKRHGVAAAEEVAGKVIKGIKQVVVAALKGKHAKHKNRSFSRKCDLAVGTLIC